MAVSSLLRCRPPASAHRLPSRWMPLNNRSKSQMKTLERIQSCCVLFRIYRIQRSLQTGKTRSGVALSPSGYASLGPTSDLCIIIDAMRFHVLCARCPYRSFHCSSYRCTAEEPASSRSALSRYAFRLPAIAVFRNSAFAAPRMRHQSTILTAAQEFDLPSSVTVKAEHA